MSNTEYEQGRYQKKVADQEKEIRELREQIDGYQQMADINQAMVAAIVEATGPVTICQEDINRILRQRRHVAVTRKEDGSYLLTMEAGGETDGEEGTAEAGENR